MSFKKIKNRAFTLIELIIVIILIGILAGMSLPKFIGVQRNAKIAAMVRDIDTLEKAIKMYDNDNDSLPIYDVAIDATNLSDSTNDMKYIYTSLKEVLSLQEDSEEYLYKINMTESSKYHSKTKYGHEKTENDFYVYSTKTDRVYYYGYLINDKNEYQHNDITIKVSENKINIKTISKSLNVSTKKPIAIISLSQIDNITDKTLLEFDYLDSYNPNGSKIVKGEWKINREPINNPNKIYDIGEYIVELRVQDEKGLWSDWESLNFEVYKAPADGMIGIGVPKNTLLRASGNYRNMPPENSIDGIMETMWNSGDYTGWIELSFEKTIHISQLQLSLGATPAVSNKYIIEGYSNNTWKQICEKIIYVNGNASPLTPIDVEEGYYDKIKITVPNSNSWIGINEISIKQ